MSFSAINTVEQEIRQRNERHTLELQLEQAMSTYQEALVAQSAGEYEKSIEKYHKLFEFDVIRTRRMLSKEQRVGVDHESSRSSATSLQLGPATRLRAMALKNYAFLLISPSEVSEETTNEALVYLAEALELVGVEDNEKLVLPLLVQVAWALGEKRLSRLALEQLVENSGGSALVPLDIWIRDKPAASRLLGPNMIKDLSALDYLKKDEFNNNCTEVPQVLRAFPNLMDLRRSIPPLVEVLENESVTNITPQDYTWKDLLSALNDTLNSACKRSKKKGYKDSYNWAQKDLWNIRFDDAIENAEEAETEKEESPQPDEATIAPGPQSGDGESTLKKFIPQISGPQNDPKSTEINDIDSASNQENGNTLYDGRETVNSDKVSNTTEQTTPPQTSSAIGKHRIDIPASPAKRRRTERVKRSDLVLPADFGIADMNFIQQFNLYLSLADPELKLKSPAFLFLSHNEVPSELVLSAELRDILSRWDQKDSSLFLSGATSMRTRSGKSNIMKTEAMRLTDSKNSSEDDEENEEDLEAQEAMRQREATEVALFLSKNSGLHIQQVRWNIALHLLKKLSMGGQNVAFGNMVFNYIQEIDALLWSRQDFLKADDITTIFSLYADKWIKNTKDSEIEMRLQRWQLVSSISSGLPHLWISAFVDQENPESTPESTVEQFESVFSLVTREANGLEERFTYLQEIPAISVENTHVQISKFKAAAAFERVLRPANGLNKLKGKSVDRSNNDSISVEDNENQEDIKLLQAMLMPESYGKPISTSDSEFKAIQDFLTYASAQFKMGLWYTLLEKYEASGSTSDSLLGLTKIFSESMASLGNGDSILQTLSVSHDVGKRLVALLERSPEVLRSVDAPSSTKGESKKTEMLKLLHYTVRLLQILQVFIVYDDTVNSNLMQKPSTPSWSKVLPKFRELVVIWWCIFYRLWSQCIPQKSQDSPETFNDILSIVHERLGNLGYCGAANGCLLNLHCSEIVRMNWDGSSMDMSQCLKCKFGLSLSIYGDVANHHTVPQPLNATEAKQLMPLVTKLILRHRSFNQLVMRMDTRGVIDEFAKEYEVENESKLNIRVEKVRAYFEKDFSPSILRNSCRGIIDSGISFPYSDSASGIWVLQGIVMLNQYRMRRRQVYSAGSIRIESLETAISLFQQDLAAHPTRFESWVSLAQIYQYMCEDCLTFGDELSIQNNPSEYCKKALLASSAAIALKVGAINTCGSEADACLKFALQAELFDSLNSVIVPLYGYLLYLAVMPPLSKIPFKTSMRPLRPFLVAQPDMKFNHVALLQPREVSERQALRVALSCMTRAQKVQTEWNRALFLTNISLLLKSQTKDTLEYARVALKEAPPNMYDAHYLFVYALWLLHRDKKISSESVVKELMALDCMTENLENAKNIPTTNVENQVLLLLERSLHYFINADKWMYRPRYLLAKMSEIDRMDPQKAQNELMELFSLKSPTKPLVLWKRDTDLPGQHSVDMSEYVIYMADLMSINKDSSGLLLMTKRFRKVGWEMWEHAATFEHVFQKAITLTRQLIPEASDPKYSDTLISQFSTNSDNFEVLSKAMCDSAYFHFGENDSWVSALIYVSELRKNHSGPSTIAMADDVVIIVFLRIMQKFNAKHPEVISLHNEKLEAERNRDKPPEKTETEKSQTESNSAYGHSGQNGDGKKGDKETKVRKKMTGSSNRKRIIRKDVIIAAQQFLKPYVTDQLPKVEEFGLPKIM